MTITEAQQLLATVQATHGDVEVFFDCPYCGRSFPPNTLQTLAVHLTSLDVVGTTGGKATVATVKQP